MGHDEDDKRQRVDGSTVLKLDGSDAFWLQVIIPPASNQNAVALAVAVGVRGRLEGVIRVCSGTPLTRSVSEYVE